MMGVLPSMQIPKPGSRVAEPETKSGPLPATSSSGIPQLGWAPRQKMSDRSPELERVTMETNSVLKLKAEPVWV